MLNYSNPLSVYNLYIEAFVSVTTINDIGVATAACLCINIDCD